MKTCPYCAETIQDAAIVCRFCNRSLASGVAPPPPLGVAPAAWSPGIAAVLSLVIPGAGQMYKGKVGAGLVWLVCVVIGYMMLIVPGAILHLVCIVNAASGGSSQRGKMETPAEYQARMATYGAKPAVGDDWKNG